MTKKVLLYGATGFTGRKIADEVARAYDMRHCDFELTLAARDASELSEMARSRGFQTRAFALDVLSEVITGLEGIDLVINAAGPFARTAEQLVEAALQSNCHYVDINGEVDVYTLLDDLDFRASRVGVALVCGAAATPGASDWLLHQVLQTCPQFGEPGKLLGSIRIGLSTEIDLSRGSLQTALRQLREQVVVVRKGFGKDQKGQPAERMVRWHEPVGKLEHVFDFARRGELPSRRRNCSAANMIDSLTAQRTLMRRNLMAQRIETYLEIPDGVRYAYQAGALLAPFANTPWVQAVAKTQLDMLPVQLSGVELVGAKHVVVLEIEDVYRQRLIDWAWETPNVYQLTAQLSVGVAVGVLAGGREGWLTPAEPLSRLGDQPRAWFLRDCNTPWVSNG